ncbi:unnamed protein product, partial [Didymodactylos carnosus]
MQIRVHLGVGGSIS